MIEEQLKYMYALGRFGIKPGLTVMNKLLSALGRPHQQFRSIHVAGTNGKSTTASLLASVLRQTGLKVGVYTSPHLYRFNERIRINGQEISNEALSALVARVRAAAEDKKLEPTFFEFTTAAAFLYFAEQRVDMAVVEVGMGGLWDATNVITPLVSIITNIGLDHTNVLGETKEEVAVNKAGIIKQGCPVVTNESDPAIEALFAAVASRRQATLWRAQAAVQPRVVRVSWKETVFEVRGAYQSRLVTRLLGRHQIDNVCTVLTACHALERLGVEVPLLAIRRGLQKFQWEGRLDIVAKEPFILVDGAHNVPGMQTLRDFLDEREIRRDVLIFGAKKDKDITAMVEVIAPSFKHVIVTEGNYQPALTGEIARKMRKYLTSTREVPNVDEAIETGITIAGQAGTIVITGSLYMVGDALAALRRGRLASRIVPWVVSSKVRA